MKAELPAKRNVEKSQRQFYVKLVIKDSGMVAKQTGSSGMQLAGLVQQSLQNLEVADNEKHTRLLHYDNSYLSEMFYSYSF